jgi:hypothetical protein
MDCPDLCLEAFWLQELEWVLEDSHKRSCWKNSIGVSVPRPCGSDAYVCSQSSWLCLTVVYWLLECNKVPSWIEQPEYVTICFENKRFTALAQTSNSWCCWSSSVTETIHTNKSQFPVYDLILRKFTARFLGSATLKWPYVSHIGPTWKKERVKPRQH